MRTPVFLCIILFAQAAFAQTENPAVQLDKPALLRQFMDTAVERNLFRGAAVVVEAGDVILEFTHGDAERGGRAITPDSSFYLASLSKQFTSSAIMLLYQDGKLDFDDNVSKHLPELPEWAGKMTIRHLLTHTSGLGDYLHADLEFDGLTNNDVFQHLLVLKETEFAPGTRYRYSNSGYALLAQIVERLSGDSFREFTTERIFGPLGMTNAVFMDATRPDVTDRVFGYSRFHQLEDTNKLENGAGGMFGSARDLVKWQTAIFEAQLLERDTLKLAFEPTTLNDGSISTYGFGWHIHDTESGKALHHTGSLAGFRHFVFVDLSGKSAVILLTNGGDSFPLPQMATGMTNILRGKEATVPKPSLADYLFPVAAGGVEKLEQECRRIKLALENFRLDEDGLNDLGYALLEMERIAEAVIVFKLACDLFTGSANVYDSYGEALMISGQYEMSEQNYRRSLDIDPENENAKQMLKKLESLRAPTKDN